MYRLKIKSAMNNIELKLRDYLNENKEVIEKSLTDSFFNYERIIITEVEIDDNYFSAHVITMYSNNSHSISPFLLIPEKFLRKTKLEQINKK